MKRPVSLGLCLGVLCLALQNAPYLLGLALGEKLTLVHRMENVWEADISGLPEGRYFVSGGTGRRLWTIMADDQVVTTAESSSTGVRSHLMLHGVFAVTPASHPQALELTCPHDSSEQPRIFVSGELVGSALHVVRVIEQLVLGPLAALVIGAVAFLRRRRDRALLGLAAAGLVFSLARGEVHALFFTEGMANVILHLTRNLFSLAMVCFLGALARRPRPLLWALHAVAFLGVVILVVVSPETLGSVKNLILALYVSCALTAAVDLLRAKPADTFAPVVGVAWAVIIGANLVTSLAASHSNFPWLGAMPVLLAVIAGWCVIRARGKGGAHAVA
jgi:hypothetical protein